MKTVRRFSILSIGLACCTSVSAAESSRQLMVSSRVLAVARIEAQTLPDQVVISASDLQRGYVDVAAPAALQISSNSPEGFALDVLPIAALARSVTVQGLGGETELGAEGGTLVQRWQHGQSLAVSLHFRLTLAAGLTPGNYPWPLQFQVRPLLAAAPGIAAR
ncbi:MAG: hypothetical protein QM718_01860 [Steroidobacteraceae bacterium]